MIVQEVPAEPCPVIAPVAQELRVEPVTGYEAFVDLEPAWNRLADEAGVEYPFLRHEWVRTWWDCFGAGKALHILVVKAGTEVMAIAPLMLSQARMYGVPVRQLEFMANVYTERFDIIVARRHGEIYRLLWDYLRNEQARWDVLRLCQLPAGSRTLQELPDLAVNDGFLPGLWRSNEAPYIEFTGGWDAYLQRLSSNQRHKLRRVQKRLEQIGPVRLEVISSGEQSEAALAEGFRIEGEGWKGQSGMSILCQPALKRFLTKYAVLAAGTGMLQLLFLTVDRTRIAFAYALRYRNKLFVLKAGYDPNYAAYSPYNLLCQLVFRDACEQGLAEYDFLGCNEEWKLRWTKQTRPHQWLYVFPRSFRSRLLHSIKFRIAPRWHDVRSWVRHRVRESMAWPGRVAGDRKAT